MDTDSFELNIQGVRDLIESGENKVSSTGIENEGVSGEYEDVLELPMSDDELIELRDEWENIGLQYEGEIKARQNKNKLYYAGRQGSSNGNSDSVISSNLLFEAEETFIPQALSKNPEPVVWSDNTNEGKEASNDVKTMLQYHADILCLRRNLALGVRNWSIYLTAVWKHGWDEKSKDISLDSRKPQNFVFDKDGYIDVYANYKGRFLGERIQSTAAELIDLFPKHKDYIYIKCNGKLGTPVIRTEWWTDEYCFTTFQDKVLDKHKNEYFNYDVNEKKDEDGQLVSPAVPGINHFASPKMPYTFLSVFSLQERPHDITNLIEQNIPNQDRITERDLQITKNLASGNNAVKLSGISFNKETAGQARDSFYEEGFLLIPDGNMEAAQRIPASPLPNGILESQAQDKETLRQIFGTNGLVAQPGTDTTARGQILNQNHDSTRIGGGIGDALEQVADNIFNWWLQLYYVFYDEEHYGAIMGNGRAVDFVALVKTNMNRHFIVSVSANSMAPKDEVAEQNMAIELANAGWLDPINLFKKLNYPDPMETAKAVTMFRINPQLYFQTYFPEVPQPMQVGQAQNPPDVNAPGGSPPQSLSAPEASSALSQVPINTQSLPK